MGKKISTELQKKVAKIYIDDLIKGERKKSKAQMIKEAGGSRSVQVNPSVVFDAPGFRIAKEVSTDIVVKQLGITKNSRLSILAEMIHNNPDFRAVLGANDQITKILGEYAPVQQQVDDLRTNRNEIFKPQ